MSTNGPYDGHRASLKPQVRDDDEILEPYGPFMLTGRWLGITAGLPAAWEFRTSIPHVGHGVLDRQCRILEWPASLRLDRVGRGNDAALKPWTICQVNGPAHEKTDEDRRRAAQKALRPGRHGWPSQWRGHGVAPRL